jgi:hypothetical protein
LVSLLVAGCAPKPTQSPVAPDQHDPCRLIAGTPSQLDTLTVALLEHVDLGDAATPSNDSERFLFRNLADNLIRLDCEGAIRGGLAESWTADLGRRRWTFTLREGPTFPDGRPLSASDVAGRLRTLAVADSTGTNALGIDSTYELDDRRLRVLMRGDFGDSLPRLLADPALALLDGLASAGRTGAGSLAIPRRGNLPVIEFRFPLEGDARDALDRDVDLVVTRDPLLVDYVSNRAEFATFPLPWSRTYVLLETENREGELAGALSAASVRNSLAKDAVRAGARAAEPPYWWSDHTACRTTSTSSLHPGNASSRVVYRTDDEVARGLAERIVALAPAGAGLRAVALDAAAFETSVRGGTERAYVVGLPRQSLAPCRDASMWPEGARLLPLIDTRAYAIVRKGAPPLTVDWDGTIRVAEP